MSLQKLHSQRWISSIILFWVGVLYSVVITIICFLLFKLADFGLKIGLKSFVVTKFPQKWQSNRLRNLSDLEYMPARFECKPLFASLFFSCILYPFNYLFNHFQFDLWSNKPLIHIQNKVLKLPKLVQKVSKSVRSTQATWITFMLEDWLLDTLTAPSQIHTLC